MDLVDLLVYIVIIALVFAAFRIASSMFMRVMSVVVFIIISGRVAYYLGWIESSKSFIQYLH
ncbi:hypothetical protein [Salipaludibacillus sp. CF4.18]|uniref:hypothetical protein n=1 Tax=Salipaludibacillus sp. CF4.18 TaxID=3373081 RepID=UPI003EE740E0